MAWGVVNKGKKRESGVRDVLHRINNVIRDKSKRDEMINRVLDFVRTKDDRKDLRPSDQSLLYRRVDLGRNVPVSNKKTLEIDWSDHAKYRSELRDVPARKVNDIIVDKMREKINPQGGKVPRRKSTMPERMRFPSLGTVVLDYDVTKRPAETDVITVWASKRLASEIFSIAKQISIFDGEDWISLIELAQEKLKVRFGLENDVVDGEIKTEKIGNRKYDILAHYACSDLEYPILYYRIISDGKKFVFIPRKTNSNFHVVGGGFLEPVRSLTGNFKKPDKSKCFQELKHFLSQT